MKTTGEILKQARTRKNIEINQVAKETKIRSVYLRALEEDDYQKLPSPTSARGFIKNYAEFLGLSSAEVIAIFRRDFDEKKGRKINPLGLVESITKPKFTWTPKTTTIVVIAIFVLLFIFYLIWQYFSLMSAPYY